MTNHRLAIIVLNWNGADDAIACMSSLLAQKPVAPDIILVDNNSSDDSVTVLRQFASKHPKLIHFIANTENSGYSGGNNVGLRYAIDQNYEYVGSLNPDATADSKWCSSLVRELDHHPEAGLATGILARSDKLHVDSTGDFYTTWGIPSPRGRDGLLTEAPAEAEYIFGSTGGGFLARVSILQSVGVFDERFFMYFEDVDLCFRAQLAGFRVRYTPRAIAYHKLSASTNKVPGLAVYNTFKNLPMLFIKNVPRQLLLKIGLRFWLSYHLILVNAIVQGRGLPAIKGWLKAIKLLPHSLRQRKQIQNQKQVDDEYISSIILHDIPPEQTGLRKFRKLFTGKG